MRDVDIPIRPLVDGPVQVVAVEGEVVVELGVTVAVLSPDAAVDAARQLVEAAAVARTQ